MTLLAAVPYHTFPDFQLGPLTIRSFGLMVALGIVLGVTVAARYVANRGLDADEYTNLATKVAIVGLIGARVMWVLTHLDTIDSPIDVIAVWEGGMQFSGALIFGAIATFWWSRGDYEPADRWALLDGTALGVAIGLMVGRIGCIAVGEHFGGETTFFLGMTYRGGGTVEPEPIIGDTIHNTAFYEFLHLALLLAIIAVLLRRAGDRDRPLVPGTILGLFLTWYGIARFLTDFLRINDSVVAGLTGAQWGCIVITVLGIRLLATGSRRAADLAAVAMAAGEADQPEAEAGPSNVRVLDDPGDATTGADDPATDNGTDDNGTDDDVRAGAATGPDTSDGQDGDDAEHPATDPEPEEADAGPGGADTGADVDPDDDPDGDDPNGDDRPGS